MKLDEALIFDAANAREFLATKLEGWVSVETCKKTVATYYDDLIMMDKHFWLEASFLQEHFDSLIEAHMRSCMLDVMPAAGEKRVMAKACTAARTLATGPVAMAQRKSVIDDLSNAANALLDIGTCSGPTKDELQAMSHWLQCFHKRAENFGHVYAEDEDAGGEKTRRSLFGRDAILYRWKMCCSQAAGCQDPVDMKEFRTFRWMLNAEEAKLVAAWQRQAVVSSKDKMALSRKKALKDLEAEAEKEKKRRQGDAGSAKDTRVMAPPLKSQVVVAPLQEPVPLKSKADERSEAEDEMSNVGDTGVLSFFGARAL